jgi:IS605 OrfB family transposase
MSKLVIPVKLVCSREESDALVRTLRACNAAAQMVSDLAWDRRIFRRFSLQQVAYGQVKDMGLGAQAAIHVVRKVADAYNSGDPKFRRSRHRRFRWSSAQPYDARNLSFDHEAQTISIWTVGGRRKGIRFQCAPWQRALLASHPIGECDLVFRNGCLYLFIVIEVEDTPMNERPSGWLGVDLGIVNPAVTSDGECLPRPIYLPGRKGRPEHPAVQGSGSHVNAVRYKNLMLREKLQQKGTRSAKRLLAKRSGCESRFARDVNHRISKTIVAEAERTGRGIAREHLEGIRGRARFRKPQRAALHSWSFHQLGTFIGYKARRAGVPVIAVDPAYTSQQCSGCGHIHRKNRPSRDAFKCTRCGLSLPADLNAAINIAVRGTDDWVVSHATVRHAYFPAAA